MIKTISSSYCACPKSRPCFHWQMYIWLCKLFFQVRGDFSFYWCKQFINHHYFIQNMLAISSFHWYITFLIR